MADIVRIHQRKPKAIGLGGEARIALAEALRKTPSAAVVIVVIGENGEWTLRQVNDTSKIKPVDAYLRAGKIIDHTTHGMLET